MVTGTLGTVPLTSAVYAQIPPSYLPTSHLQKANLLAKVMFGDGHEVLGLIDGQVFRDLLDLEDEDDPDYPELDSLPQLILT